MTSQTIFSISLLPAEVLNIITDYLEAQETTKFWISANNFLKGRLEGGGIIHLRYITNQLALCPFKYRLQRWPKLIGLCKQLRSLIISVGSLVVSPALVLMSSDLQTLPRSLTHLEVQFEVHDSSFYRDIQVESTNQYGTFKPSLSSSLSPTLFNPWDKSHIFDQLEYLRILIIRGKSHTIGMKSIKWPKHLLTLSIDSEIVPGYMLLPKYLTSLSLPGYTRLDPHFFDSLPKGLIYLSMPSLSPSSAVIAKPLPPTLESLEIGVLERFTRDLAELLPQKLTKLTITCQSPIPDSVLEWFPHELKEVSLNGMATIELNSSKWPSSITRMSCNVTHLSKSIPFPSTLTSLNLPQAKIQHSSILELPPTLLVLIAKEMAVSTLNVGALPPKLTHLSIDKWEPTFDCLEKLPRNLRYLSSFPIDKVSFLGALQTPSDASSFLFFPPKLTYLQIITLERLPYPIILPNGLRSLIWRGPPHFAPTPLPSSLTDIFLHGSLSDASMLPPLPPSLLRLHMSAPNFSDFHWGSQGFSLLPTSLRYLYTDGPILYENLTFIPPHLIVLGGELDGQAQLYCRERFPDLLLIKHLQQFTQ